MLRVVVTHVMICVLGRVYHHANLKTVQEFLLLVVLVHVGVSVLVHVPVFVEMNAHRTASKHVQLKAMPSVELVTVHVDLNVESHA